MDLKKILNDSNKGGSIVQFYSLYRRLVLRILEKKASDQNKPARFDLNKINDFNDAELPNGLDEIIKPIVVDIRLFKDENVPSNYADVLIKELEKSSLDWNDNGLIAIVGNKFPPAERKTTEKAIKKSFPKLIFHIWDIKSLEIYFEQYAEYLYDLIPELTEKAVQNVVSKSLESYDWESDRSKHLKRLKRAYSNDQLVFFLGAGVSASAKLPSWDLLLSQLLINLIETNLPNQLKASDEQKNAIAGSLKKANGSSPLLEARYIRSGLGDNFEQAVSDILYKKNSNDSDLISAITELSTPPRGALGIKAIVNYNFDDLIEEGLLKRSLDHKPIFRETDLPEKKELGIYHVHGFLPRNRGEYEGISDSLLVFSEENYHLLMQEPYHWSNLIQLNFLKDSICLLIGLSGTDPNLRRLLEIAKRKTNKSNHYILLKRQEISVFEENLSPENPQDAKLIQSIHEVHHKLNERSLDELGLNVILYESYDEIPEIIKQIKTDA